MGRYTVAVGMGGVVCMHLGIVRYGSGGRPITCVELGFVGFLGGFFFWEKAVRCENCGIGFPRVRSGGVDWKEGGDGEDGLVGWEA